MPCEAMARKQVLAWCRKLLFKKVPIFYLQKPLSRHSPSIILQCMDINFRAPKILYMVAEKKTLSPAPWFWQHAKTKISALAGPLRITRPAELNERVHWQFERHPTLCAWIFCFGCYTSPTVVSFFGSGLQTPPPEAPHWRRTSSRVEFGVVGLCPNLNFP